MRRAGQGMTVLLAATLVPATASDRPSWAQDVVAQWTPTSSLTQVVDLTPPRDDGRLVVAANGRLFVMAPGQRPQPFARRKDGYKTSIGEAYIALSPGQTVRGAGCRFPAGAVAGLDPLVGRVLLAARDGQAQVLAQIGGTGLLNGIAFDEPGGFRHRLLVTSLSNGKTTLFALDCRGRVRRLRTSALAMEGGMAVAPLTFGQYGGRLIITDEYSGHVYAVGATGHTVTVADPGLPSGGDTGTESTGFVPNGFGPGWAAYVADRAAQPQPHPGDDRILRLDGAELLAEGVRPGDLLVAGEGGGPTVAIHCEATCSVQHVADGPPTAHAEGHIVFARG